MTVNANLAIEINNVSKVYDNEFKALDDVTLTIPKGMFFGLLGPNGAGKTTLINILGGLTIPTFGSVTVAGYDVKTQAMDARRSIGIVPQEVVFDPFFNTRDYLLQQSNYYGLYDNHQWVAELMDKMGLSDKATENTRTLSGGMKRRMMVGMAMVHKPQVVVLDEPTAGVDVEQRNSLWEFINKLNDDGTTVILTTHNLDEAEELCERIVMLNHGKIIADENTQDLISSSKHHAHCVYIRIAEGQTFPTDIVNADLLSGPDEQGRYQIIFDEYKQIGEITHKLNNANIDIKHLEVTTPDLEDVFMSLTQN